MKRTLVFATALTAAAMCATVSAEAGTRWRLDAIFGDTVPAQPDGYFFDDGYVHETLAPQYDETDNAYSDGPGVPSVYDYDPSFYEPQYQAPRKRIDRLREGLRKEEMRKQALAKPANLAPVPAKPASPKIASIDPAPPPARKTSLPSLKLPEAAAPKATAGVSCDKAAKIVGGYGFSDVKPKTCAGDIFAFNATRGGKAYEILLSSKNGALTEVKRQ